MEVEGILWGPAWLLGHIPRHSPGPNGAMKPEGETILPKSSCLDKTIPPQAFMVFQGVKKRDFQNLVCGPSRTLIRPTIIASLPLSPRDHSDSFHYTLYSCLGQSSELRSSSHSIPVAIFFSIACIITEHFIYFTCLHSHDDASSMRVESLV